jgi:hypothetical protein
MTRKRCGPILCLASLSYPNIQELFQQLYKRNTKEGLQNNGKLEALYRFDATLEEEFVIPPTLLNRMQIVPDIVPFAKDIATEVVCSCN